jgi:hypothetical protein
MRSPTRVAFAAGLILTSASASGEVNTRVEVLLSQDGVNFTTHLQPMGGANAYVEALVRVTYIGTDSPLGLGALRFQPTVSNWRTSDYLLPMEPAFEPPSPEQFGRVPPFRRVASGLAAQPHGHIHTDGSGGAPPGGWMRIATLAATGWIGAAGNTSGGAGVTMSQLNDVGRTPSDPPFSSSLSVSVFRFGMHLDFTNGVRAMTFDIPLEGFGNLNTSTGEREVHWWASMNEPTPSIRGTAEVLPAFIVVPGPASFVLVFCVPFACLRSRRPRNGAGRGGMRGFAA